MQRNRGNHISGRLIPIRIGHVRKGHRNALGGHILDHSHCSVFVARPLGGDAIGGLEIEAVVAERVRRYIPVVDGSGFQIPGNSTTKMQASQGHNDEYLTYGRISGSEQQTIQ